jgi:DNA-binding CsgD family transcriptional regulator
MRGRTMTAITAANYRRVLKFSEFINKDYDHFVNNVLLGAAEFLPYDLSVYTIFNTDSVGNIYIEKIASNTINQTGLQQYKNRFFKEDLFVKRLSDGTEGFGYGSPVTITDIAELDEFWETDYGRYLQSIDTPFQAVLRASYAYLPPTHVLNVFKTESQGDFSSAEKKFLELVAGVFSCSVSSYKQYLGCKDFISLLDFETEETKRILAIVDDEKQQIYCNHSFAEKISGIFGSTAISESMNKFYAVAETRLGVPFRSINRNVKIAFGRYDFEIAPQYVSREEGRRKYFSIAISDSGDREPKRRGPALGENYNFTLRESEIAELLLRGSDNNEIAEELCLSVGAVKFHIGKIYEKLGVKNRISAIIKLNG